MDPLGAAHPRGTESFKARGVRLEDVALLWTSMLTQNSNNGTHNGIHNGTG